MGLRNFALVTGVLTASALALAPAAAHAQGVDPPTVNETLAPGGSVTVTKTVGTPAIVPTPDIYFLADTTGSMGPTIDAVKASAADIIAAIDAAATDPQYGAGNYKDFQSPTQLDPYAFQNQASIPDGEAATLAAINSWSAGGGLDTPEANLFGLHQLLAEANFRSDATKIVVWFGDAPGHDPVCANIQANLYPPPLADVTEASVTAELVAAGVRVISVSTTSGPGLDSDPAAGATDYVAACGAPGGTAGQATRIATATGGQAFSNVPPEEVAAAILEGLNSLPVTVAPVAVCDEGLSTTFNPPSQDVTSGDNAVFQETITLAADATPGVKACTVDFLLNGTSAGAEFVQQITVTPEQEEKKKHPKPGHWKPGHWKPAGWPPSPR